ncbi:hypothetical protein SAMN00790413_01156 [Deinococcus hopiensis KR-140]|uniref:Uncharacterized protein n=1 Tax=Deinococcus hopiensis KR-140 TaxID=695939 RepID=A0A1W1VE62_9DEIO|nr:hypothetical protein SAMN00790413_01156 [Deinococcus hopiensis KR-140]
MRRFLREMEDAAPPRTGAEANRSHKARACGLGPVHPRGVTRCPHGPLHTRSGDAGLQGRQRDGGAPAPGMGATVTLPSYSPPSGIRNACLALQPPLIKIAVDRRCSHGPTRAERAGKTATEGHESARAERMERIIRNLYEGVGKRFPLHLHGSLMLWEYVRQGRPAGQPHARSTPADQTPHVGGRIAHASTCGFLFDRARRAKCAWGRMERREGSAFHARRHSDNCAKRSATLHSGCASSRSSRPSRPPRPPA